MQVLQLKLILQKYDIANMQIAQKANASVLLVSDIDKGGSFASLCWNHGIN